MGGVMATKAQLLAALAPFAAAGKLVPKETNDRVPIVAVGFCNDYVILTHGDLRRAAEVVGKK